MTILESVTLSILNTEINCKEMIMDYFIYKTWRGETNAFLFLFY